jgi:hypothetical protein
VLSRRNPIPMRRPGDDEQLASRCCKRSWIGSPPSRPHAAMSGETLYGAPMAELAPLRRGAGATDRPVDGRAIDARTRRGVCRLAPRHRHTSPNQACGTPVAARRRSACSAGRCGRKGFPFRTQHPLGAVVNRPSVWSDR